MVKKASGGKSATAKAAGASIALAAVQQLLDPKVRQQVVDQGLAIHDRTQAWRRERAQTKSSASAGEARDGSSSSFADRFGHGKLERRSDHLKKSIADLRAGRPEMTEDLAPFFTTLGQIDVALGVAAGLPAVKRLKAHREIDHTLDDLEKTIFKAAMPKRG